VWVISFGKDRLCESGKDRLCESGNDGLRTRLRSVNEFEISILLIYFIVAVVPVELTKCSVIVPSK
jgi:hypothetical protein